MQINIVDWVALILLLIGGLDMGVVGLFNYDPLIDLMSNDLFFAHLFFALIGLAALYAFVRVYLLLRNKS